MQNSQTDRILTTLYENTDTPGISAKRLAKLAKVAQDAVSKRIFDLRNEGFDIFTNYRNVKGNRTAFYRLDA